MLHSNPAFRYYSRIEGRLSQCCSGLIKISRGGPRRWSSGAVTDSPRVKVRLPSSSLRGIPSGCDLRDAGHGLDARCGRGHPANPPRYAVFNQTSSPRFRHSSPVTMPTGPRPLHCRPPAPMLCLKWLRTSRSSLRTKRERQRTCDEVLSPGMNPKPSRFDYALRALSS